MDAIEKRARELLGAQFTPEGREQFERGQAVVVTTASALNAIIAALTPPEGFVPERSVLVAATRLRKLASAATPMGRAAYIKAAEMVEMAVAAARAEVP
ncbi:hypothetical protein GUL16_02745 [Stenotrophomonas maltophilia]|uniref:hypothetical protein n=1 Tax=Stenotrophomonas pavanii TaxID=487698 RepID=UPI001F2C12A8|nr:hypothetical protein [Stenotrophomonas pavanii]MCF3482622.1 hypothetical protein [Stenotrophomonas maltophilia]